MEERYQVDYTAGRRRSRWQPMVHREGEYLCIPANIKAQDGEYEFDEYRLSTTSDHSVPRIIVNAMADAMDMLAHYAIQHMDISKADAICLAAAYPEWDGQRKWRVGDRCTYRGALYERQQPWAGPEAHPPGVDTASLWVVIVEDHTGSETDPIPYSPGMVLEKGLQYTEARRRYVCTRDSGSQVFHALADLIGIYVEEVTTNA